MSLLSASLQPSEVTDKQLTSKFTIHTTNRMNLTNSWFHQFNKSDKNKEFKFSPKKIMCQS